ncbi:MAG: Rpp14/Pop5 family protein [Candidatus Bathyarchaeia archaeon]
MKTFKTRYLALKFECDGEIDRDVFWNCLIETYLRLYGEYGFSKANIRLLEFKGKSAIISVDHAALPYLRAALTMIRELNGVKTIVRVLGVSGTIKRLKAKFLSENVGKS